MDKKELHELMKKLVAEARSAVGEDREAMKRYISEKLKNKSPLNDRLFSALAEDLIEDVQHGNAVKAEFLSQVAKRMPAGKKVKDVLSEKDLRAIHNNTIAKKGN